MADRWFRVPVAGQDVFEGPYPKYVRDRDLDFAGTRIANSPQYVARVYGTTSELDALASEADVTDLSGVPVAALNTAVGQERDAAGWEEGFNVS